MSEATPLKFEPRAVATAASGPDPAPTSRPAPAPVRRARVVAVEAEGAHARVALDGRPALARRTRGCPRPAPGDEALLVADDRGDLYLLDLLPAEREPAPAPPLRLRDGATVETAQTDGAADGPADRLRIRSAAGDVLLEYDAASRVARVRSGEILEIGGSAREVRIRAAERLTLAAAELRAEAGRTAFVTDRGELSAGSLRVRARAATFVARRIETWCEDSVLRARTLVRNVRDALRIRAGRTRTVVEGTAHVAADRYVARGRTEIKLKSDKVHLA